MRDGLWKGEDSRNLDANNSLPLVIGFRVQGIGFCCAYFGVQVGGRKRGKREFLTKMIFEGQL